MNNFSFPVNMCIYINIEYWLEYPFKPLAKSVLIPLGLTAAASEIEAAFHEKCSDLVLQN